jgi:hypothetical protein
MKGNGTQMTRMVRINKIWSRNNGTRMTRIGRIRGRIRTGIWTGGNGTQMTQMVMINKI